MSMKGHNWAPGMAVVFAHNEEEAREIMKAKFPEYIIQQLPFGSCKVIKEPDAFYVCGGG